MKTDGGIVMRNVKSNFILLVAVSMMFLSCTANLHTKRILVQKTGRPTKQLYNAIITKIDYCTTNNTGDETEKFMYYKKMEKSIVNSIYNSGLFKDVRLSYKSKSTKVSKENVYFDIAVEAKETRKYNWWITWPALYPISGYWPIQSSKGNVDITISTNVYYMGKIIKRFTNRNTVPYEMVLYSFYRTGPVESSAEQAYSNVLYELTKKVNTLSSLLTIKGIHRIAVLPLVAENVSNRDAIILTDKLCADLSNSQGYDVIERRTVKDILKEQGFQQTGCTTSSCNVKVGRLLGVTHLIAGTVGKIGNIHHISVRIVDVSTGNIVKYVNKQYSGGIEVLYSRGVSELIASLN